MKNPQLEAFFREAFPEGLTLKELKDITIADGQSMAILHPLSDVRINVHKKSMSIPRLGWIPLTPEQMMQPSFDWVAGFDSTGKGTLELILGVGNPYKDAQAAPLPTKAGRVMAVPVSIAKVLR